MKNEVEVREQRFDDGTILITGGNDRGKGRDLLVGRLVG